MLSQKDTPNLIWLQLMFCLPWVGFTKATETQAAVDVTALEMVKWFDSNYHYVRPTFLTLY